MSRTPFLRTKRSRNRRAAAAAGALALALPARSRRARNRKALRWSLSATAAAAAAGIGAWAAHEISERRSRRRRSLIPSRRRAHRIAKRLRQDPETRALTQRGVHLATHALSRAMDEAERRLEARHEPRPSTVDEPDGEPAAPAPRRDAERNGTRKGDAPTVKVSAAEDEAF